MTKVKELIYQLTECNLESEVNVIYNKRDAGLVVDGNVIQINDDLNKLKEENK